MLSLVGRVVVIGKLQLHSKWLGENVLNPKALMQRQVAFVAIARPSNRGRVKFISILMAFLVLPMVACKSVQPTDIQGRWVLRDGSRQVLPAGLKNAEAKVVLDKVGLLLLRISLDCSFFHNGEMQGWNRAVVSGNSLRTMVNHKWISNFAT
jgi:hypothetical protein